MFRTRRTALAVVTAATAMTTVTATGAAAASPADTAVLRQAVTAEAMMDRLALLQKAADNNGGTRASGTPGYAASLDLLEERLLAAGYEVTRQDFLFDSFRETADPVFARVSPDPRTYVEGEEFLTSGYSGSGTVDDAPLQAVDVVVPPGATANTSTSGCEAADFAGFVRGSVALVQRGTCTFADKAANAFDAGASGVVVFNEGQEGRQETLSATLGDTFADPIPVVGTSFAVGEELVGLLDPGPVLVDLVTSTEIQLDVPTQNLVAETPTGRDDQVVMAGAHLDSVVEGPGIEDNGTGSVALLEIALRMAELGIQPRNTVRFAWWGAEEAGLVGSQHYVDSLPPAELGEIDLYLNFDMIGSPNYARFVYDGDGSAFGIRGPNGSERIEALFAEYFAAQGLASEPTAFNGRSDYDAFISAGIPAGGLFTGAEDVKTPEQVTRYGGLATHRDAPVAYDPCYHQACDSMSPVADGASARLHRALDRAYDGALQHDGVITNVNTRALEEMSDAAAHAVLTLAMAEASVKADGQGPDGPGGGGASAVR